MMKMAIFVTHQFVCMCCVFCYLTYIYPSHFSFIIRIPLCGGNENYPVK